MKAPESILTAWRQVSLLKERDYGTYNVTKDFFAHTMFCSILTQVRVLKRNSRSLENTSDIHAPPFDQN